ncbi:hypothetical protein GCM10027062_44190 [Nocardioides hungaricus]
MTNAGRGLPYHLVQRGGLPGAWRPIVGVPVLIVGFVLIAPALAQIPFAVGLWLTGHDVSAGVERMLDLDDPTPLGLAYLNATLASAILLTWLIAWTLHGLRPGWVTSVAPRMRWRWFAVCLGLSVIALLATLAVSALVPEQSDGAAIGGDLNEFTSTTRDFLLVVLLLTPFQAAGEEYLFRGYLAQAFGSLFGRTWIAVVLPSLLFAAAHGSQSVPLFLDRLAFGLVSGVLVVLTGGLEAGIAMHVLNNWVAFGLALAFGDMASTLDPDISSWWMIPVTLTRSLVFLGLAMLVFRRMKLRDTTEIPAEPGVLAARTPRV